MLNIDYIFEDSLPALRDFEEYLDIPSLPLTVLLMQRDVISQYYHCLNPTFLDIGTSNARIRKLPTEEWTARANKEHEKLSFMISNLMVYTLRLIYHTEWKGSMESTSGTTFPGGMLSFFYDIPISRFRSIGFTIEGGKILSVTRIAVVRRELGMIRLRMNREGAYRQVFKRDVENGDVVLEELDPKDEKGLYKSSFESEEYDLSNPSVLYRIQQDSLSEIARIKKLSNKFRKLVRKHASENDVTKDFRDADEHIWTPLSNPCD